MSKASVVFLLAWLVTFCQVGAEDQNKAFEQYQNQISKQTCTKSCIDQCGDPDFAKCLHQCSCHLMLQNPPSEALSLAPLSQEQLAFSLMQTKDKWVEYKQYATKLKKEEKKLAKAATLLQEFQDAAQAASLIQGCDMHCAHQCINIRYDLSLQVECIQGSCECAFAEDVSQLFTQNIEAFSDLEFETVQDSTVVTEEPQCNSTCTGQCDQIRDSLEEAFYKRCLVGRCRCTLDQVDSKLNGSPLEGAALMSLTLDVEEENNSETVLYITLGIVLVSLMMGASALLSPLSKRYRAHGDIEQNSKGRVKYVGEKKKQKREKKAMLMEDQDKLTV